MNIQPVNLLADRMFNAVLANELDQYTAKLKFEYTAVDVPSTGKAVHSMYLKAIKGECPFKVFNGANDAVNLYFAPNTNLLYRAVHDLDHAVAYSLGRGTTKYEDELYLNCIMAKRAHDGALKLGYSEQEALLVFFTVYHDTVGQVHYYVKHKDFCTDQRAHTVQLLDNCRGYKSAKSYLLTSARTVMLAYLTECGL